MIRVKISDKNSKLTRKEVRENDLVIEGFNTIKNNTGIEGNNELYTEEEVIKLLKDCGVSSPINKLKRFKYE